MWGAWKKAWDAKVEEQSFLLALVLLKSIILVLLLILFSGADQSVVYVGF